MLTVLRFRGPSFAQGFSIDGKLILNNGTPLTFSTQGYTEVRYDEERKRVVYEPLQLTQAFR